MKLIMKLILPLLMVAFLIVGCDKTNNPAAPINVGQLQLVVTGPTQHTEFAGDTLSYRVFVMSADSSAAVDGTIVRWLVTGHGQWENPVSATANGVSTNNYILGAGSGTDTLIVLAGTTPNLGSVRIPLHISPNTSQLSIHISRDPALLYATGRDSLEVVLTLRDTSNVAVPNANLILYTAHGIIPSTVITDASGSAHTFLIDNGDTTSAAGTYLFVHYPAASLIDSALYFIRPQIDLDHIVISGPTSHVAYPGDTVSFTATLYTVTGRLAPDSTKVYWNCYLSGVPAGSTPQNGFGQFSSALTRTVNGATSNVFYLRTGTGRDSIALLSFTPGHHDTVRAWSYFDHIHGSAVHVILFPRNVSTTVNGSAMQVQAIVTDTAGNMVPYSPVTWGCDDGAGTIVSTGYSSNGDTSFATLTPGNMSGQFRYWAIGANNISDTASFVVSAIQPYSMLLSSDSNILQARGTGGTDYTQLHALVRDYYGHPMGAGTRVQFMILNVTDFDDTTHNQANRPYFNQIGHSTDVTTTNGSGEATTYLSAGMRTGTVQLVAYVLNADSTRSNTSASLSNITIIGGAPYNIAINIDPSNATQAGAGFWSIELRATIRDMLGNPVADGQSVNFRVVPSTYAAAGPDTSVTRSGIANSRLIYHGTNSYDTVTITASIITRDAQNNPVVISNSLYTALPLVQGTLNLNVSPNTFLFSRPPVSANDIDVATHMVWATVRDGYGTFIHGCPILFSVQRGRIFKTSAEAQNRTYNPPASGGTQLIPGTNPPVYWPVNKRKTGNYTVPTNPGLSWTDPNGYGSATVYIGALGPSLGYSGPNGPVGEVFLDPQTLETTSEVTALIEGYPSVQPVRVLINYQRE